MASSSQSIIFGILVTFLSLSFTSHASNIPNVGYKDSCASYDVGPVIKIFSKYQADSKLVCTKLLRRSPPKTVTITKSSTIKTTTTVTNTAIATVKNGVSIVVLSKTATSRAVDTATATLNSAVTVTVTATAVATAIVTNVVTISPQTTVTVTLVTAAPVYKRKQSGCLGDSYPSLPRELRRIDLYKASQACECFLQPTPSTTITITRSITAKATVTIQPLSTTIPSTTSTSTDVFTTVVTLTVTDTVTAYTTLTATEDVTSTEISTLDISTALAIPTDTVYQTVTYSQITLPRSDCVYNRYYDYPTVNNDPTNNYQSGVRECQALCTSNPTCKMFFVLHFDPSKARGYDATACILDEFPYDASLLQCGYVNNFNVAYNKNL